MKITYITQCEFPVNLIPLMGFAIPCGFPAASDDFVEKLIDLNRELIPNPVATIAIRVFGESMEEAKISSGDILLIDKSVKPYNGAIVLACINGEQTIKVYKKMGNRVFLVPRAKGYRVIEVSPESDFQVEGIITYIIYNAKKNNLSN